MQAVGAIRIGRQAKFEQLPEGARQFAEARRFRNNLWIDRQRAGTARPFPLWRLSSGPLAMPIDPLLRNYRGSRLMRSVLGITELSIVYDQPWRTVTLC